MMLETARALKARVVRLILYVARFCCHLLKNRAYLGPVNASFRRGVWLIFRDDLK